jgi:hypothetical protein
MSSNRLKRVLLRGRSLHNPLGHMDISDLAGAFNDSHYPQNNRRARPYTLHSMPSARQPSELKHLDEEGH